MQIPDYLTVSRVLCIIAAVIFFLVAFAAHLPGGTLWQWFAAGLLALGLGFR